MKNYTRLPLSVKAEQYFPYSTISIEGFRNIEEEVLDEKTMEKKTIVVRGELVLGDVTLSLSPGDWVIIFSDNTVKVRSNAIFVADFIEDLPEST